MNLDIMQRLVSDKLFFFENVLRIENKRSELVPYKLKPIQLDMYQTQTGRDVLLKPAQVGSTTLWMSVFYHDCITKPGTTSVVVAHEEFITQRLLAKVHFFEKCTPDQLKPRLEHKSAYEMTWPDIHSTFYIGSARSYVFGRGDTIHNLLCSEYAYWPDTAKIIGPASDRVPLEGKLIIESTPNGEDNDFHDLYKAAKQLEEVGGNRFKAHFYPWTLEADYQLPPDSPYALARDRYTPLDLTAEEMELARKLGTTEDQIRWRRMKIAEKEQLRRSGEMVKLFSQEFPENDESCFITAGDMLYDSFLLTELSRSCYKAPDYLHGAKVWQPPQPDIKYELAIDPGMGINTRTAITVWQFWWDGDVEYGRHCATIVGLIPPVKTAELAIDLAKFYNHAMIAVEANNHGLAVVSELKSYGNVYRRKDIVSGKLSYNVGWLTTPRTKPYMVKEVAKMLPRLEIHDLDIVSELRNMRTAGDIVGSVGSDDLHDSVAIALVCRQSKPGRRGYVGSAGYRW